jgi:hypothetical protein
LEQVRLTHSIIGGFGFVNDSNSFFQIQQGTDGLAHNRLILYKQNANYVTHVPIPMPSCNAPQWVGIRI